MYYRIYIHASRACTGHNMHILLYAHRSHYTYTRHMYIHTTLYCPHKSHHITCCSGSVMNLVIISFILRNTNSVCASVRPLPVTFFSNFVFAITWAPNLIILRILATYELGGAVFCKEGGTHQKNKWARVKQDNLIDWT